MMKESSLEEGGALNVFGENFDYEGNKFTEKNSYKIYGTSINYLLDNKILETPDYIKIDVDGIEHLILRGFDKHLHNSKIKSLSIEINKNFSIRQDIKFLDMTDILKKKSLEIMIYGPKDYENFNKYGYKIISNQIYKNYQ